MNNLMTASRTSSLPRSEVRPSSALDGMAREQMFLLLTDYFDGVTRERFDADLAEKESVILLRDKTGAIKGFTTMMRLRVVVDDEPVVAFFSGDTIVAREYWGEMELPRLWTRHVFGLRDQMTERHVYWFLICSGYKTYRFLPVFFRDFFPTYRAPLPAFEQRVLDTLGRLKFGEQYHGGIIRFTTPTPLRKGVAEVTTARQANPDVVFYVRQNPGHINGDELACLCPLELNNFTRAGRRAVGR